MESSRKGGHTHDDMRECAMRTQIRKHETRNKYERKRTWKKKDGQNG